MLTKKRYSFIEVLLWSRIEILFFSLYTALICVVYYKFELYFFSLPWAAIGLIGTAAAFIISFQNNAAYGRIWEARKIYGGIVNSSRTFGMKINDMLTDEYSERKYSNEELHSYKKAFITRHIAWMTALRHALRAKKPWEENQNLKTDREWVEKAFIPEKITSLKDDLKFYLEEDEFNYVISKNNKAAAVLYLQSKKLREFKEKGLIWEFSFLELENLLEEFFTLQGKSERIKNFPYPRQYATLSHSIMKIFLTLLPFGLVPEFYKIGKDILGNTHIMGTYFIWLSIPFCMIVSWIFALMDRIGRVGENPFEGGPNDVPISSISRAIEIDLRQLYNEEADSIPCQFPENHNIQM